MIDFVTAQPLSEAVDRLGSRTPLGSALSSREWELVPVEQRELAFFSATVEDERILAEMQRRILQRVKLERTQLENGESITMDRSRFIEEMQTVLRDLGYQPPEGKAESLQDISSATRLGLIWDIQLAWATEHAKWKMSMDPDMLDATPAQELVRLEKRENERDWPRIWVQNGGTLHPPAGRDYPEAKGRMIALKTDPIWTKISRFGLPWPPYDWGSGMGLKNTRRREAEALGLLGPDDVLTPLSKPFGSGAKASLAGIPQERRNALADKLAGDVEIVGDEIHLTSPDRYAAMEKGDGPKAPPRPFDKVDQAPKKIAPQPVIERVKLEIPGNPVREVVQAKSAIALADKVHSVAIPPVTLTVNPTAPNVSWATLQSLGLALDKQALHTPSDGRPFASWGQPELAPLMREIDRTAAHQRLVQRAESESLPTSSFLLPQEVFSRAYAQFIQVESADRGLTDFLLQIRRGEVEGLGLWRESQWSPVDFTGVRRAMRALLKKVGWIGGDR